MRYAGRLARLWRRVALLPPRDPLGAVSDADMARAARIIAARLPPAPNDIAVWRMRGETPPPPPEVPAEDAAWFAREIEPRLPAYAAFAAALLRWERRLSGPRRPLTARERLACISPAFAGKGPPVLRIPATLLRRLACDSPRGYQPA